MATSDDTQTDSVKPAKSDSRDFVEHLRTVHFTLVTVCLALIVIIQSPSPVSIREAIRQLDTINDATHVWNRVWLLDEVPTEMANVPNSEICFQPVTNDFVAVVSGTPYHFRFAKNNWVFRTNNASLTSYDLPMKSPKNLGDFKNMWDNSYSLICPTNLSDKMLLSVYTENDEHTIVIPIEKMAMSANVEQLTAYLQDYKGSHLSVLKINQNDESDGLMFSTVFETGTPHKRLTRADPMTALRFPVESKGVFPYDFRDVLIKELPQYHWLHSDFRDAFRELDQATTGFQDLDFEHLKQILLQSEKNSKEAFQAFGVTFPIETTTRWGSLIIIAIQFYFLLHFMEYRKKQTLVKPEVAWIGIYTSLEARFLFCATALAIPVGVIAFVCIKAGLLLQMPILNFIVCTNAVAFSSLFALLTAKEYFKKDAITPANP